MELNNFIFFFILFNIPPTEFSLKMKEKRYTNLSTLTHTFHKTNINVLPEGGYSYT